MVFYAGRNYTTTLTNSINKEACCEKCGAHYLYTLTRKVTGTGSSPYYLNNAGAQKRSRKDAEKKLVKALKKGVDPVPCPQCGWLQADMVRVVRKGNYKWMKVLGWTIVLVGIAIWVVPMIWTSDNADYDPALFGMAASVVALGVLMFGLRFWRQRRFDPNADYAAKVKQPSRAALVPYESVALGGAAAAFSQPRAAPPAAIPTAPTVTPPPMPAGGSEWFYEHGGQQAGPITFQALRQMATSGQITPANLIWKDGMPQWTEAGRVRGLFAAPGAG